MRYFCHLSIKSTEGGVGLEDHDETDHIRSAKTSQPDILWTMFSGESMLKMLESFIMIDR